MSVPTELRARLAADYAATRRLPPPIARTVWVVPFALLALVAAPTFFNVRSDAPQLGWLAAWGASLIQLGVGVGLIAAALRESIPGRGWNHRQLLLWMVGPLLMVVAVTFSSAELSQIPLDANARWRIGVMCLAGSAAMAMPIVALASVLAVRAYPTRPAIAGALLGCGAGVVADAGWRLFCHFGEPTHVLSAHLGGVLVAAAAGAALAIMLRRPSR
jgi:hypothetical protein